MKMNNLIPSLIAAAALAAAGPVQARSTDSRAGGSQSGSQTGSLGGAVTTPPSGAQAASVDDVMKQLTDWPSDSQNAARAMTSRYGRPDVTSDRLLVWLNKTPFTKIEVMRDGIPHSFPTAHKDVLLEETRMAVPVDKLSELAQFDGSLIVDRVKGTVAARGDREAANLLALNLADEIVGGKRDATSARQFYADTLSKQASGKSSAYTDSLKFSYSGNTADGDHEAVGTGSNSSSDSSSDSSSGSNDIPSTTSPGSSQDMGNPSGTPSSQPSGTTPDNSSPSPQP